MAFADTQSVTIATVPITLERAAYGPKAEWRNAEGDTQLSVFHTNGRRKRTELRLTWEDLVTDPLNAALNVPTSTSVYVVVDSPVVGGSYAVRKDLLTALKDYLGVAGNIDKVAQQQL